MAELKEIVDKAKAEVDEEYQSEAKRRIKAQMRVIASAERALANEKANLATLIEVLGETWTAEV